MLPAGYVGAHVDHGYASTVDTAQGATVDYRLFTPLSDRDRRTRLRCAVPRSVSNRIYATRDRAWIDAIGQRRGHAFAVDQSPSVKRTLRQVARLGGPGRTTTVSRHSR